MPNYLIRQDNSIVHPGDTITDFRGQTAKLVSFRVIAPPSTGRVCVLVGRDELEYYPGVYDLSIVTKEDYERFAKP